MSLKSVEGRAMGIEGQYILKLVGGSMARLIKGQT